MKTQTGKHCWSNLSTQQRNFIKAFAQGETAYEAGLSAGYRASWSESKAQELLNKQKVQQALAWYTTVYTLPKQVNSVEKSLESAKNPQLDKKEKSDSFKTLVQEIREINQAGSVVFSEATAPDAAIDDAIDATIDDAIVGKLGQQSFSETKKCAKKQPKVAKSALLKEAALVKSVQLPVSELEITGQNNEPEIVKAECGNTTADQQNIAQCVTVEGATNIAQEEQNIAKTIKEVPTLAALLMDARKVPDVWHDVYTIMCQSRDDGDSKTALKCLEIECKLLGLLKDRKNGFEGYLDSEGRSNAEIKEGQDAGGSSVNSHNLPNPVVEQFLAQLQTMSNGKEKSEKKPEAATTENK